MHPPDVAPSPAQRRVLAALKRRGEATAEELASTLGISPSAARQHLGALRSTGLVAARQERGQPGRPADRYRATELTEPLFVSADIDLSSEILRHVEEEDPEIVNRVLDRRRRDLVDGAKHLLSGKSIDQRVLVLTELLDEQGYLADSEKVDDEHYRINLHSCAIWPVASRYRQACSAELDFLRDAIPDAAAERVTHKTSGAHTCAYEISVRSALDPANAGE